MITRQGKQQFLDEAIRIGDELLMAAKPDYHGLSWATMGAGDQSRVIWQEAEDLYHGVSGIILFLLELYQQTNDERYLQAGQAGMRSLIHRCHQAETKYNALFTGHMGVVYTLLKLYQITTESCYLNEAKDIAKACITLPIPPQSIDDLISGTAGTLLGLLHLDAVSHEPWIVSTINQLIEHMIDAAELGEQGLYWDRSYNQIKGLCGHSHGAAGIGFVFLELGYYYQNDAYYYLAEKAFQYENHHFDTETGNWPDYRKWLDDSKQLVQAIVAHLDGDGERFTTSRDSNFWCHGAAGIGLSRLRGLETTKRPFYRQDALVALQRNNLDSGLIDTTMGEPLAFCLCHGIAGNADLFLEAYRVFDDAHYWHAAQEMGKLLLCHRQKGGLYASGYARLDGAGEQEDSSLFMGNAGIGYFFLRLIDPLNVPSVLAPHLPIHAKADTTTSPHTVITIKRRLLDKAFGRTLVMLDFICPQQLANWLPTLKPHENQKACFINFVTSILPSLSSSDQKVLNDVFTIERTISNLDDNIPSHALLKIEEEVQSARASKIVDNDQALYTAKLSLNKRIHVLPTGWQWPISSPNQWVKNVLEPTATYQLLLQSKALGISEVWLYPLAAYILTLIDNQMDVGEIITTLDNELQSSTTSQNDSFHAMIQQQIMQLLTAGILVCA